MGSFTCVGMVVPQVESRHGNIADCDDVQKLKMKEGIVIRSRDITPCYPADASSADFVRALIGHLPVRLIAYSSLFKWVKTPVHRFALNLVATTHMPA